MKDLKTMIFGVQVILLIMTFLLAGVFVGIHDMKKYLRGKNAKTKPKKSDTA